jgi:hypothetical protein
VRGGKASTYSTEWQMFTCDESQRHRLWLSSLSFIFFFHVPFFQHFDSYKNARSIIIF